VPELDQCVHLAVLDEVGMGLENRIELLGTWNLLAVEHATARLIEHTDSLATKVLDLLVLLPDSQIGDHIFSARFAGLPVCRSCAVDDFLGNTAEFAVCPGLLLVALPCGHPFNLLRRADRARSRKPLIRRRSSATARRPTKRTATRTTSHNSVLSVG